MAESTGAAVAETAIPAETPEHTLTSIHTAPKSAPQQAAPSGATTPPAEGQEPEEEEFDPIRARALITKLRAEAKQASRSLKELDQLKAERQQAADAQLSKEEQLTKRATQLEAQLSAERTTRQERVSEYEIRLQALTLGIVDPDAAYKLLDKTTLEYDAEGRPQDVDKALKALLKQRPYLAGVPTPAAALSTGNPATRRDEPGQRRYTPAEIGDRDFYNRHKDDITAAIREGRIDNQ